MSNKDVINTGGPKTPGVLYRDKILALLKAGESPSVIAERFQMNRTSINKLARRALAKSNG